MWSRELLHIRVLLKRLAIVLLLFTLCRIIFFAFNYQLFPSLDAWELLSIMLFGLRYDLAAILIINSLFILMHVVPNHWREKDFYQKILKIQFYVVNGGFLLLEAGDFIYFQFASERTSSHILGLRNDIVNLIPQFLLDFWYVLLICLGVFVLVEWLYRKTHIKAASRGSRKSYPVQMVLAIAFILVSFIGVRGGLQEEPLTPQTATSIVNANEVSLVTNTTFTILHSILNRRLQPVQYFPKEEAEQYFSPYGEVHPVSVKGDSSRPNIMVIMMESFSSEYTGYFNDGKGYTPFFDSLMKQSLVYTQAYANGKHSIDALPSIMVSLPSLMTDPFITSFYQTNNFKGIGSYLKPLGYQTAFFHGGNNNTMECQPFIAKAGFDQYFGRNEFGDDTYYDGNWGIFDESFFQFTAGELNKQQEPFFAFFFSLSSHHPFTIPEKYKDKFAPGTHPIHKAVEYADYSLQQFFKTASQMPWFDNTIFIITADHTGPIVQDDYKTRVGTYSVPIVVYAPGTDWKGERTNTVQQLDIMPTVLSLAGYQGQYFGFGQNLLVPQESTFAVNQMDHIYQLIQGDEVLQFDGEKVVGYYNLTDDPQLLENEMGLNTPRERQMTNRLKAMIQGYVTSLRNNEMTPE